MKKKLKSKKRRLWLALICSIVVLVILILLVLMLFYQKNEFGAKIVNAAQVECMKNSDCIILRGTCCSCENGGTPQCVAKVSLRDYTKKFESCSDQETCFDMDCGKINCGCVDNKCVGWPA